MKGLKNSFDGAAASYDEAAALARETGARMAQRLGYTKIDPRRMADIGCATGDGVRRLQAIYPKAQAIALDYSLPMLRAVRRHNRELPMLARISGRTPRLLNADVRALPMTSQSLGLIWSNLMLHWLDDPLPAIQEMHRVLEVGGLLMFTALGPDTLKELRGAAQKIMRSGIPGDGTSDAQKQAPSGDTLRRFLDMHDLGDMLVAAGFADPVMDMEMLTLTYARPRGFLADQRHLGVRDALLGKQAWQHWRRIFGTWPKDADGRFPASFEIIYGHAWKPASRKISDGRSVIHFQRRVGV